VDSLSHIPELDPLPVGEPAWDLLSLAVAEAVYTLRRQLAHPDRRVAGRAAADLLRFASSLSRHAPAQEPLPRRRKRAGKGTGEPTA
jgi:hypothetical protein